MFGKVTAEKMLGGLMDCLTPMVDILSECGWKNIIIETVGAGQSEIRVVAFADRILLVDGPDRGDIIQAEKAGIMELADLIVINKSDLPEAERAAKAVRSRRSPPALLGPRYGFAARPRSP